MKNILLTIKYDGSGFSGWQIQPGKRTVQGELEKALSHIFAREIGIQGSSRTDSGVHALGQCACFKVDAAMPTEKIPMVVNNLLKGRSLIVPDLEVLSAKEVEEDFHPRFNAVAKRYAYRIICCDRPDIFKRHYYYQIGQALDISKMQEASGSLLGLHDFKSFMAAGGNVGDNTERIIYKADFTAGEAEEVIEFEIVGDGFLYNMVRIIVGTLVEVGQGKIHPEAMAEIIDGKDRSKAGHTAPPGGLYLDRVFFSREEMDL